MAYSDTPLAQQRFKDSQPQIEQNFIEIDNLIAVDHYTFGSPNAGDHMKVTLPNQGVAPVFLGNDIGLWAQIPTSAPLTTFNELYIRRQDGTTTPITASGQALSGWAYLPSGLLIKWGTISANNGQFYAYPVATNIPAFSSVPPIGTNPYIVQLTFNPLGNFAQNITVGINSANTTYLGFGISVFPTNAAPIDVSYLAIGI